MADKIKIRRGLFADLPDLDEGELGLVKDRGTVYVGTNSDHNILLNPVLVADDGYTLDGYLYPAIDNIHGLGTPDKRWSSVSVGPGSIHVISKDTDTGYSTNKEYIIGVDPVTGKLRVLDGATNFVLMELDSTFGAIFPSGGGVGGADQEHFVQQSEINNTIISALDGYAPELTFQQYKAARTQIDQSILQSLDGYAQNSTSTERYTQQSEINNTIISALDGYAQNSTVTEHYQQISTAIDLLRQAADAYGTGGTEQAHYSQQSVINNAIISALDGYAIVPDTSSIGDGYVAFFIDGGKQIAGHNELFWDRASNRLKVGGPTPSTPRKLNVIVDADTGDGLGVTNTTVGNGFAQIFVQSDVGLLALDQFGSGYTGTVPDGEGSLLPLNNMSLVGNSASSGGLAIYSSAGQFTHLGADGAIFMHLSSNRNVGIKTRNPIEALTINGVLALQEQTSAPATQDGYGKIYVSNDDTLHYKNGPGVDQTILTSTLPFNAAGADGYIAFYTNTGTIAGDNDLYWDRVNEGLLLGATNLTVGGTVSARMKILRTDQRPGLIIEGDGSLQADIILKVPTNAVDKKITQLLTQTDGSFVIRAVNDTFSSVTNTLLVGDLGTGNIGIATTALPSQQFEVRQPTGASAYPIQAIHADSSIQTALFQNEGRSAFGTRTNNEFGLMARDVVGITLRSFTVGLPPLVGIGTRFPIEALTVSGTLALQELATGETPATQDGYGKLYVKDDDTLHYKNGPGVDQIVLTSAMSFNSAGYDGYLAFYTNSGTIAGDNDLVLDRATNILTLGGGGTYVGSAGTASNPTYATGATNTGIFQDGSGNLAFTISGTQYFQMTGAGVITTTAGGLIQLAQGNLVNVTYASNAASNTGIYFPSGSTMAMAASGIEVARVTNDRFAIGNTNPQAKLHVSGDGYFDGYLMPFTDNMWGLGTPDVRWRDLYLGPGSLHIVSKTTDSGRPNRDFVWDINENGDLTIKSDESVVASFNRDTGVSFGSGTSAAGVPDISAVGDGYLSFFIGSGANIAGDNDLFWDRPNQRLLINTPTAIATGHRFQISNEDLGFGIQVIEHSAATYAFSGIEFRRSRGELGARTTVSSGDVLGSLRFKGYNGSGFNDAALIEIAADGAVSGGGVNDMPGRIVFSTTADGASTVTERMRIDNLGHTSVLRSLSVGYTGSYSADGVLTVGDSQFYMYYSSATDVRIVFDSTDYLQYDRSANRYAFNVGGTEELVLTSAGAQIPLGLNVGFSGSPTDDSVSVGDTNFRVDFLAGGASTPGILFDSTDLLVYSRGSNQYQFRIGGSSIATIDANGLTMVSGNVLPNADNAQDIGNSTSLRWRTGFFGTRLNVGLTSGTTAQGKLHIVDENATDVITVDRWSNTAALTSFDFRRGEGTQAAKATIASGDTIGSIRGLGWDNTSTVFRTATEVRFEVDGTVTAGSADMPGRITFFTTPDASATLVERMRIRNGGAVDIGLQGTAQLLAARFHVLSDIATNPTMAIETVNTSNLDSINMFRSRGTIGTKTVVTSGDQLGAFIFSGYNGSVYNEGAAIKVFVDSTVTGGGASDMPGRMAFFTTPDGTATGVERMRISNGGRFTIGGDAVITGEAAKLQILNNSSGSIGDVVIEHVGTSSNDHVHFRRARGSSFVRATVAADDPVGVMHFLGYDGTGYIDAARIEVAVDGTPGTNDMPGRMVFSTTADGTTTVSERMRITNVGRIGVNTTNPQALLHVAGDGYYDGYLMPFTDNVHWLGTPDKRWQSLYLGPSSLHIRSAPAETTVERDWSIAISQTEGASLGNLLISQDEIPRIQIQPTDGYVGINGNPAVAGGIGPSRLQIFSSNAGESLLSVRDMVNAVGLEIVSNASANIMIRGGGGDNLHISSNSSTTPAITVDATNVVQLPGFVAYASVTTLTDTTANDSTVNPFRDAYHAAFVENTNWKHNVGPVNITYGTTTGQFQVGISGVYSIEVVAYITSASTAVMDSLAIRLNGATNIWQSQPTVHSSVDPACMTIIIYQYMDATNYVELTMDGAAATTVVVENGTTFNIRRIG